MDLKEAVEYKGDSKVEATIETVDVDQAWSSKEGSGKTKKLLK